MGLQSLSDKADHQVITASRRVRCCYGRLGAMSATRCNSPAEAASVVARALASLRIRRR